MATYIIPKREIEKIKARNGNDEYASDLDIIEDVAAEFNTIKCEPIYVNVKDNSGCATFRFPFLNCDIVAETTIRNGKCEHATFKVAK